MDASRWRTARATVGTQDSHQHKVRDEQLRQQARATVDRERQREAPPPPPPPPPQNVQRPVSGIFARAT